MIEIYNGSNTLKDGNNHKEGLSSGEYLKFFLLLSNYYEILNLLKQVKEQKIDMDKFFDKIKGCNFDFLDNLIEFSNSDTMEKNICEGKETYGARLRNLLSPCKNLKSMIENFGEKKDVFINFMTKSIDDYINNGKDFDNFCNKVKNLK